MTTTAATPVATPPSFSFSRTTPRPTPAPRTLRGRRDVAANLKAQKSATLDAATMQDCRSRRPFLWAPSSKEEDFNLTELIHSVERKIWLLEEMENRPIAANSLLSLKSESETTEEDLLLTLPGYKPKKVAATRDPIALNRGPLSAPSSPSPRRPPPALPPKQRNRGKPRQKLDSVCSEATTVSERSAATASGRLQNNGGIVSNALYYSRRLPEVSSMHCGRSLDGGLSKLEAVALAKELCEAAVSSLGSPCRARLLFCPLCTQSFGYSYGLESHLLSVHHDELLADRRPKRQHHPCPCCHGHFLRVEVLIRHLVYHHEDFVTGAILATDDYVAEHVNCRFCGKQFLRRHQKLLMLHIEQKHVDDLRRLLDIRLPIEQHLGIRIPRPLPLEIEGVVLPGTERRDDYHEGCTTAVSRDLDEDCQFLQHSPVPRPSGTKIYSLSGTPGHHSTPAIRMAKRSLIFEPSPNYHHYYDILDDSFKGKRERSSEEDETTSDQRLAAKMKQVKKRVKRIDQKGNNNPDQVRRSREIQDLLKRNPNYQRPKRGDEATECLAASTPCVMKAKKSYRRPHRVRHHSANNDSSSTYLGVEQPKPEGEEQEEEEDEGIVVGVPAGSESAPGSPLASHFRRGGSCRWSLLGGGRRRKKQSSGAKGAANRERSNEERRGAQRLFMCNLCEVAFLENAFLLSHHRVKHPSYSIVRPRYSCGACPAKFFKNSFLVKHVESHIFFAPLPPGGKTQ